MFRNYRRYYFMNNNYQDTSCEEKDGILENSCNNVSSYEEDINDCDCGFDEEKSVFPDNPMLAQSYVPIQYMDKTFKPSVGLKMGTIFPELVSPYSPCQDMREQEYIARTNKTGEGCNG